MEDDVPEAVDRSKELKTAAQMTELPNRYLQATLWFICPLVEGLSNDFRRDIRFLGFNIREEALFFDAEFKAENNPGAIDIAKALQKLAAEARPLRVSQPFQILDVDGAEIGKGQDIVRHLQDVFWPTKPTAGKLGS